MAHSDLEVQLKVEYRIGIAMLSTLCWCTSASFSDILPNVSERREIENHLSSLGYSSWKKIELEDDCLCWEIDDAIAGDGVLYNLKLERETLQILTIKAED